MRIYTATMRIKHGDSGNTVTFNAGDEIPAKFIKALPKNAYSVQDIPNAKRVTEEPKQTAE